MVNFDRYACLTTKAEPPQLRKVEPQLIHVMGCSRSPNMRSMRSLRQPHLNIICATIISDKSLVNVVLIVLVLMHPKPHPKPKLIIRVVWRNFLNAIPKRVAIPTFYFHAKDSISTKLRVFHKVTVL